MLKSEIEIGMKVHRVVPFKGLCQNGIIKDYHRKGSAVFVVYHCGGKLKDYRNWPGALTFLRDLRPGWRE